MGRLRTADGVILGMDFRGSVGTDLELGRLVHLHLGGWLRNPLSRQQGYENAYS